MWLYVLEGKVLGIDDPRPAGLKLSKVLCRVPVELPSSDPGPPIGEAESKAKANTATQNTQTAQNQYADNTMGSPYIQEIVLSGIITAWKRVVEEKWRQIQIPHEVGDAINDIDDFGVALGECIQCGNPIHWECAKRWGHYGVGGRACRNKASCRCPEWYDRGWYCTPRCRR